MRYEIEVNGRSRQVTVHRVDGRFAVAIDGKECAVDAARIDNHTLSLLIEDGVVRPSLDTACVTHSHEVTLTPDLVAGGLTVRVDGTALTVSLNERGRRRRRDESDQAGSGPQRIVAPMPGKIVRVLVKKGEAVLARQAVVVIEAMKMENELRAASNGTMAEIYVQDGQSVDAGALLAVIHR